MTILKDCLKTYTADQDKAALPAETISRVRALLAAKGQGILAETRRIDSGRLGIPVFLSVCGPRARQIMPTRKQMGKGASPEQAEASALMELMERYSFFSFWENESNFEELTWSQAQARWPGQVLPLAEMLHSVGERLPDPAAQEVLDLVTWRFCKALHVPTGSERRVPLDWFKLLNEFNGSSAGNTFEETLFQGACEIVERHVSALVDRERPELPTIDPESFGDEVLEQIMRCFTANGVKVWLKDFTLGMPVPTVAALAYDPSTFPGLSEIVYTAGTASTPAKAAIRALTEVAQLAGDFHTSSNYEASGLSKYKDLAEIDWLTRGPVIPASTLPDIGRANIRDEIMALAGGLNGLGFPLYGVETTNPELGIPATYNFAPGFQFRERSRQAGLGLFVGRKLAECADPEEAVRGLQVLARIYPGAHFIPFFEGMAALNAGDASLAFHKFQVAEPAQPDEEDKALCAFYAGYALTLRQHWDEALPHLDRAVTMAPEVKEYFNLRGVARFKQAKYTDAAADFRAALALDSGSAMDLANLGLCHENLGEQEPAKDYLREALRLDPSLDFAREHLAELEGNGQP
ncbi:MAG: YcaO-like family protein [Desulfocurvibacter africanus]